MSQRNRIVFATAALVAALFLATPSPSRAAGGPWSLPVAGAWERAWSWLASLLPGSAPQKPAAPQRKEGGAVNPNGTGPGLTPPSTGAQTNEGGAMNPDGVK